MTPQEILIIREQLANRGKELTPTQLEQQIKQSKTIHIDTDNPQELIAEIKRNLEEST